MLRILANDGLDPKGVATLTQMGHEVVTEKVAQEQLHLALNDFDVLIIRSATKVDADLIDKLNRTRLIIRAGVGLDNIDVTRAQSKGIMVSNTPSASSRSVAELAFAHAIGMARLLHQSNRKMPVVGNTQFKTLKNDYSSGVEMEGKTMGIIGFGRIGRELAKISLGAGMSVIAHDPWTDNDEIEIELQSQVFMVNVPLVGKEELLRKSDFISVHTPKLDKPTIGESELSMCKKGVYLLNTSRGGVIDENALLDSIANGHVAGCALDVFENEPTPDARLLQCDQISLSPHIGASTNEAQLKIADVIIDIIDDFARKNS